MREKTFLETLLDKAENNHDGYLFDAQRTKIMRNDSHYPIAARFVQETGRWESMPLPEEIVQYVMVTGRAFPSYLVYNDLTNPGHGVFDLASRYFS